MRKQKVLTAVIVVSIVFSGACAKRVDGSNVTPYEQVMSWNAAMAVANNYVARGVIESSDSGFLSVADAAKVIAVNEKISQYDIELTAILAKGPQAAKLEADQIRILLLQIRDSSAALVRQGLAGEKLNRNLNSIYFMADLILGQLQSMNIIAATPTHLAPNVEFAERIKHSIYAEAAYGF
jgi:hypothetical protein